MRPFHTMILMLLAATGCSQRGHYDVQNRTDSTVNDVTVVIGKEHRFPHGILGRGSGKGYSGPISGRGGLPVEISWRAASGQLLTNRTTVHQRYFRVEDNVHFVIVSTGVVTRIQNVR